MEFRDLKTQYSLYKTEIDSAIQKVLAGGGFIGGEPVRRLEDKLAEYVGAKYCITCANGTDALLMSLMAWGLGEGDAVFVPDFTFFSTSEVIPWVRATPVFVDINKDTFNLSASALEESIERVIEEGKLKPKAVIAVDLFGQPANYIEIRKITDKHGLFLLEDGAQGFGGSIGSRKACSFGDISTTSFFPAKPLGCYGDGGAVFTDCDDWAELIRSYKVHGKGHNKYDNIRLGMNSRLDTIQAAVLEVKLDIFIKRELDAVNEWAEKYNEELKSFVKIPTVLNGFISSWAQYTILLENEEIRENTRKKLSELGIPSMVYYPKGLHEQKAMSVYADPRCSYPVTEKIEKQCLSLPIHPYMENSDYKAVVSAVKRALQ